MADYTVEVAITATNTDAVREVREVGTELQGLEGKARRGFQGAEREGRRLEGGLRNLQTTLIGLGGAFITQLSISGVMAMRELGAEAIFAERRFEALAGGPEAVGAAMDILRQKTGGAVSDMRLQIDAAGLMMTGLAGSVTEAADLIALGLQLGGEQGVDALSRALKNNSIEMLDNLGISAAAVRELRDQYTRAGMDSADAFARATLEIGKQTAERLGDAAEAGITSWNRVKTWFENEFANAAESVAGFLELAAQDLITAIEAHNLYWSTRPPLQQGGPMPTNAPADMPFSGVTGGLGSFDPASAGPYGTGVTAINEAINRERMIRAIINREQAAADRQRLATERVITTLEEHRAAIQERRIRESARVNIDMSMVDHFLMREELDALRQSGGGGGFFGDQRLFSEQDVRTARDLEAMLAYFAESTKTQPEFFSAEQIERARTMASEAEEWANYIEKGAEAARNMTMSQVFGQGVTNPLLAGLGDSFLDLMKGDLDDDTFQRLQDAIGLQTGAETQASLRWRDEGLPTLRTIYEQFGQEAALEALEAYERGARAAAMTGTPLGDPLAMMGYLTVADGSIQRRQVDGWTPYGLDRSDTSSSRTSIGSPMGTFIDDADTALEKMSLIQQSIQLLPGAITPAADEMGKVRDVGTEVQGVLDGLAGKEYALKFALTASEAGIPVWLKELIRSELAVLVRNNGGVVPGSDPRARANGPTRMAG